MAEDQTVNVKLVDVDSIIIGNRARKRSNLGDLQELADNIKEVGLLNLPIVNGKNELRCGERRILACKLLGWKEINVRVMDLDDVALGEISENYFRKNFTVSETFEIISQISGTRIGHRPASNQKGVKLVPFASGKTRDIVSRITRKSAGTISKIQDILKAAAENPKFQHYVDDIDLEKISVNEASNCIKRERAAAKLNPPARESFNVVLLNTLWERNEQKAILKKGTVALKQEEMKALMIPAALESILLIRSNDSNLDLSMKLITFFGFKYSSSLVFRKKTGAASLIAERYDHLLIGVRGKPKIPTNKLPDTLMDDKAKSEDQVRSKIYDIAETVFKESKRIEIFPKSEVKRDGWTSWL